MDALGSDPSKKLIFIPNGGEGNVTVAHQNSPDKHTLVDTVATFAGAKIITVGPVTHNAYLSSLSEVQLRRPLTAPTGWRTRPRPARSDRRRLVYRNQAVGFPAFFFPDARPRCDILFE